MTLTRLLEIKMELLRYEDKQGLHLAERLWSESGEPIEPQALCRRSTQFLMCTWREESGFRKFLLPGRNNCNAERGNLMFRRTRPNVFLPRLKSVQNVLNCAGTGHVVRPGGGSVSLCTRCEAWKRNSFSTSGKIQ